MLYILEQFGRVAAEPHQVDARLNFSLQHLLDHRDRRGSRKDVGVFVKQREPQAYRLAVAETFGVELGPDAVAASASIEQLTRQVYNATPQTLAVRDDNARCLRGSVLGLQ